MSVVSFSHSLRKTGLVTFLINDLFIQTANLMLSEQLDNLLFAIRKLKNSVI